MSNSYQNEVPKARVDIKLDLHTGGAQRTVELPLKLLAVGDYSNGQEQRPLSEREKVIDAELKGRGLVRFGTAFMPEGRVLVRHLKQRNYL